MLERHRQRGAERVSEPLLVELLEHFKDVDSALRWLKDVAKSRESICLYVDGVRRAHPELTRPPYEWAEEILHTTQEGLEGERAEIAELLMPNYDRP